MMHGTTRPRGYPVPTMTHFALDNATLWIGDGGAREGHVVVRDGIIDAVGDGRYAGDLEAVDLRGGALSPGLIDLMVLGGFDLSILRDDPLQIARQMLTLGVTSCEFCGGMLPWDDMKRTCDNVRRAMAYTGVDTARVLGIYLEGPFEHPERTGAALAEHALPPTQAHVRRVLDEVGDAVPMINVSPGTPGDVDAIRALTRAGKVVSMAHSDAPGERVLACVEAGTSVLGHVWNNHNGALAELGVQQPTLEHVALTDDRVRFIHMICDGTHVHPIIVRLVLRCRGVESLCLVTDAVTRAGCPDGPYESDDGRRFCKKHGVGRTDGDGLCGSGLLLPDHLRNFINFTGTPAHEAIRTVTLNPARSLGLDDRVGLIAPGRAADLVLWDEALRVRRVWRAGRQVANLSDLMEVQLRSGAAL